MDLRDLVRTVLAGDLLTARQWVADARHARVDWEAMPKPEGMSDREMTVAAGLTELLATRAGSPAPAWTDSVGGEDEPLILDPGLEQMPRSFARAKAAGPPSLRRRNLVALPDFLDVA